MTTFTRESVNAIYTNIISDYIAKGYVISTQTHSGNFSHEVYHIDLCKDNEYTIHVWMMDFALLLNAVMHNVVACFNKINLDLSFILLYKTGCG